MDFEEVNRNEATEKTMDNRAIENNIVAGMWKLYCEVNEEMKKKTLFFFLYSTIALCARCVVRLFFHSLAINFDSEFVEILCIVMAKMAKIQCFFLLVKVFY